MLRGMAFRSFGAISPFGITESNSGLGYLAEHSKTASSDNFVKAVRSAHAILNQRRSLRLDVPRTLVQRISDLHQHILYG